jgi:magnesium-protoporphyrin IX monomethyl ester (oxidative) cyclase
MKKGTSVFQNIQLLKNCVRAGIEPAWNLLLGFPGEPESTFAGYVSSMPLLAHLAPPEGAFPVRFDRYSPYFNNAAEYGLDLHPVDHYRLSYPFPEEALREVAYYFADRSISPYMVSVARWIRPIAEAVGVWKEGWNRPEGRPVLRMEQRDGTWWIEDSRPGRRASYPLDALTADLLIKLDRPTRLDRLQSELPHVTTLAARLESLRDRGLIFTEGERAMSLALADTGVDPMRRPRRDTVVGARRTLPVLAIA